MISNCGKDERGAYSGGVAGDQTGGEYAVINWYSRPWDCVLRYPDASVRSEIAKLARAAANNNNIGYDQNERMSFWNQLSLVGYNPASITVPCEADCSSSTAAIVKAVGYRLNISGLKNVSAALSTYGMRSAFRNAGFVVLTDSKYLTSPMYLLAGDILLNDSSHVAINLDNGGYADTSFGQPAVSSPVVSSPVETPTASNNQGTTAIQPGDLVMIATNASWWTGSSIPAWVKGKRWNVVSVNGLRAVLGKSEDGRNSINSPISTNFLIVINPGSSVAASIKPPDVSKSETKNDTIILDGYEVYIVQRGDSLWSIAVKQLGSGPRWTEIQALNNLNNDRIYAGQKLKMPKK